MSSFSHFFSTLALLILSTGAIAQNNHILNGSFETHGLDQFGNTFFEHWVRGCNKPYNTSVQEGLVHTGAYAVAYDADACVVQNLSTASIAQVKGQEYELSCWINYGYSQGGEYGSLQVGYGHGSTVVQEDVVVFPTGQPGALPTWQKVTMNKIAPNQDLAWAYVSIYANAYVLVDSCEFSVKGWGAEPLSEIDRPQRNWLNAFNGASKVVVTTTIENALNQCPLNDYCELEVNQLVLDHTVYLNRPKTKITGLVGNKVTFSQASNQLNNTYFKVESNNSNIIIEGLNIDGESVVRDEANAILVSGNNINNILINNNNIHHIYVGDSNAHGIAVYGTGVTEAAANSHIIIESNQVHHMKTGSSESIVVNGNVKHWEIVGNTVNDVNNIAIDAIGGEGTSPTILLDGRIVPGPFDIARYGFIENNSVFAMSTETNSAYNNQKSWAAGIYVDGADYRHSAHQLPISRISHFILRP